MVKKNILDSKPTANKKCDLISVPKKTTDTASVVRTTDWSAGVLGWFGLYRLESPCGPGHRRVLSQLGARGFSVNEKVGEGPRSRDGGGLWPHLPPLTELKLL